MKHERPPATEAKGGAPPAAGPSQAPLPGAREDAARARARRALALADGPLLAECRTDVFVGGGPGGQHRNKTESGVRIVHLPTGIVATATERRSQHENRRAALERLRARLERAAREARPRRPTRRTRASQERRIEEKRRRAKKKAERRNLD